MQAALDKAGLADRAHRAGLATPRTQVSTPAVLTSWAGPVMVTCLTHWQPGQLHAHRVEARRYDSAAAAAGRVLALHDAGFAALLQEPVDGRLGALIGLMHEGRLRGRVQQETSRLWPTPSGVSARAVTVLVHEALAAQAERLLADLGWTGLVELQFLTAPGREPALIDLNGRVYGSMALATAARGQPRRRMGSPGPR